MNVTPLAVAAAEYDKGCLRAYLEGKHDLKWIVGVFGGSATGSITRAVTALGKIHTSSLPARRADFMRWIEHSQHALALSNVL